jgi:hypothetical protein
MQTKKAALVVIAKFFGLGLKEAKDECEKLTSLDRQQLASAVAREQGLAADDCNWEMVAY